MRQMYRLRVEPQEPLDAGWIEALTAILAETHEVFLLLEPSAATCAIERQKFLESGGDYEPVLNPDSVDVATLRACNDKLEKLRRQIQDEPLEVVRDSYLERIAEAILQNELVIDAVHQDTAGFHAKNLELYGEPDKAVYAAVCAWVREEALATIDIGVGKVVDRAKAVLEIIPSADGDADILLPAPELFQKVRSMHFEPGGYVDQLFAPDGLPAQAYIDESGGDTVCRQAIANVGADYTVGASEDGIWSVQNNSKRIVRPPGYRLERDEFTGIVCHEVGSHLLERMNGMGQPLRLLSVGLDRFESGNEGRAFLREQIMYTSPELSTRQPSWEYIVMLFLGVCLASGEFGRPYTFSELHRFFSTLHAFWRERRFPLASTNELAVAEESWQLTVRIMKGTPGDGSMGCYMKDIVYLQGNIACWRMAAVSPEIILFGDSGKFDIANPRHLQILRALGLLRN